MGVRVKAARRQGLPHMVYHQYQGWEGYVGDGPMVPCGRCIAVLRKALRRMHALGLPKC